MSLPEDLGHNDITMPTVRDLLDIACHRFGFSWSTGIPYHVAATTSNFKIAYGCDMPHDMTTIDPLLSFFSGLAAGQVPHVLCDLMPECPGMLQSQMSNTIKIQPVEFTNNETWYKLYAASTTPRWYLFVKSAESALECLRRQWGPEVEDVARNLLEKGIPFTTRVQLSESLQLPPPPPLNLGWRYPHYQPDHLDYKEYEQRRNAFLSEPRGRVALLTGGIIWRLAMEVLSPDTVLVGPTPGEYGKYISTSHGGTMLWDEELTESERDLICGVYHVQSELNTTFPIPKLIFICSKWWRYPSIMVAKGINLGPVRNELWLVDPIM